MSYSTIKTKPTPACQQVTELTQAEQTFQESAFHSLCLCIFKSKQLNNSCSPPTLTLFPPSPTHMSQLEQKQDSQNKTICSVAVCML